ncbi:MAG: hypothetical protein M3R00_08435 [Pseudomonadota bacterium]|nr:hypothetical protein [Pseudomonadota bacterium]
MNFKTLKVAALGVTVLMAGCATVMTGTSQPVHVQAIDANTQQILSGARCVVVDGEGNTLPMQSNPGSVLVTKGKGTLNVRCTKPGYRQSQIGVGQSFNAWTVVNVLFWPGLIVDAATGAMQKYPSHVTVLMSPIKGH